MFPVSGIQNHESGLENNHLALRTQTFKNNKRRIF